MIYFDGALLISIGTAIPDMDKHSAQNKLLTIQGTAMTDRQLREDEILIQVQKLCDKTSRK